MVTPDDPARPSEPTAGPLEGDTPDASDGNTNADELASGAPGPDVDESVRGADEPVHTSTAPPPRRSDERDDLLASPDTPCLNCGRALPGAYCPQCGQKAGPLRQPVHHFVRDAFLEFFGIDGRIWPTLGALLFKPGTLTREYLAGRRQTYLRPLRVYLVSTLSFFFLLSVIDPVGRSQEVLYQSGMLSDSVRVADELAEVDSLLAGGYEGLADERAAVREARRAADSLAQSPAATDEARQDARAALTEAVDDLADDSVNVAGKLQRWRVQRAVLAALPPDSLITVDGVRGASRLIYPDTAQFFGDSEGPMIRSEALQGISGAPTEAQRLENATRFVRSVIGYVPTILFVILPIFALLLKGLYARRGWYYSEHLIFGLHTHAFAFVVFSALTLFILAVSGLTGGSKAFGWVGIVGLLMTIPVYFFIAQKRVYGQGWIKTAVKALLLAFVYNTVLTFGLIAVFVIAAYFG